MVSVSFATISLALKMCPESISTVSTVNRCPSNVAEWESAAKKKSCNDLGQLQSCTAADDFVYHCVLNKDATMLLEVCAPTYLMPGYCARFSEVEKRIIIDTGLDCTKFDPPCSSSFLSNESYKNQMCYRNAGVNLKNCGVSQEKNVHVVTAIVTFTIIVLLLLIVFGVAYKLQMIKFFCRKNSGEQSGIGVVHPNTNISTEENIDRTQPLLDDEERVLSADTEAIFCNLSGDVEVSCSLKGLKTISALRDKLATELGKPRGILLLVDRRSGQIFADDTDIRPPLKLMIGNQNRMKYHSDDDECDDNEDGDDIKTDVISNQLIKDTKGNKMSCGHFTVPDTLFDYTKNKLQGSLHEGLDCPVCKRTWSIYELVVYCNMSEDEKNFFLRVAHLNKCNANELRAYEIDGFDELLMQPNAENKVDGSDQGATCS